ncbi:MAG: ThiF family adenylyltransferase [Tateyamaria sp.]|uniref:ThiF family adenylyltransferase n=1 Tax=Tateyamaria sp. TaxID=1929288 RepID=UPI00329E5115
MCFTLGEQRLLRECEELSDLEEKSEWLQDTEFSQNANGLLTWSFTLEIADRHIALKLVFPALFPDLPPFVLPADDTARLSQHQYGEGGELCLQYRPDNWHPDCKSTDVVKSAKALLDATPQDNHLSDVESAHPSDLPSLLNSQQLRFLLPAETARLLRLRLAGHATDLRMTLERRVGAAEVLVARVAIIGRDTGMCAPVDGPGVGGKLVSGVLFRLPDIRDIPDAEPELLGEILYQYLPSWLRAWIAETGDTLVVVSNGRREVLLRVTHQGPERRIDPFHTFAPPNAKERRIHGQMFRNSSVCIIGAGSLGSKVAAGLAREGIGKFMLLDNDVLWSDNLVRNELDEMDVGHHKAISLKHRLLRICPTVQVGSLGMSLTSQSTVQHIAELGDIISSCDLVIDTTADSGVFRMAAAVCTQKSKPLVWGRVYAGGIGGLVARCIPPEDPPPMTAASQLQEWCDAKGKVPPEGQERDYGLQGADHDEPLFASDGDVGVIADRLVRHALDALSTADLRVHPEPAYFIGLRKCWIFDHPFDTHPVVYGPHEGWLSGSSSCGDQGIDRVVQHLGIEHGT